VPRSWTAGLAELIRAARLRIVTSDPLARKLQWVQTQYNFPMLWLASIALHRHAAQRAPPIAVLQPRLPSVACALLRSLSRRLGRVFFHQPSVRTDPSPAYRDYARGLLSSGSTLIDICGTGWSSAQLLQTLDLPDRALYFLHRLAPVALYEAQRPTPTSVVWMRSWAGTARPEPSPARNVQLRSAWFGRRDAVAAGIAVPVFDFEDRSAAQIALVAQQMECFRAMVAEARVPWRETLSR